MNRKITIDQLADAINEICTEYSDDISLGVSEQAVKVAEVGAKAINSGAGGLFRGSRYRRSWKVTVNGKRYRTEATIHSAVPGLPHLLEKSHKVGRHSHYAGRPHIEPVEQRIMEEYESRLTKVIK